MFSLSNRQYQCCHAHHLARVPDTRAIEGAGALLMAEVPLTIMATRAFTVSVCGWGGKTGGRILGKIRKTADTTVLDGFSTARNCLAKGDILGAMDALKPIGGLGQYSYSSKHLRMLAPNLSAVLDSRVKATLSPLHPKLRRRALFLAYCDFCRDKALTLTAAGVKLGDFIQPCAGITGPLQTTTALSECKWRAADVDMACFAWLQGWCGVSGNTGERLPVAAGIIFETTEAAPQASRPRESPSLIETPVPSDRTGPKLKIWLNDQNSKTGKLHGSGLRILAEDKLTAKNIGAICRKHGCLDLKLDGHDPRVLIREIGTYSIGGAGSVGFPTDPRHRQPPHCQATHCWNGGGYEGGLDFGASQMQPEKLRLRQAVAYLKAFFEVRACPGNHRFDQAWVNGC